MSHELDFSKGRAAIAYRGEVPWHGFGEVIQPNDTLEEIQRKAGLDWNVESTPALYKPNGETLTFENREILYRSDTKAALSMVSKSNYKVRQPKEVIEYFRNLCDGGAFQIEVAGALQGGKKIWALASRTEGAAEIMDGDTIKPYMLLQESFDGTLATTGRITGIRVVCQNTADLSAMIDRKTQSKQKHSQEFDPERMQSELAVFDQAFATYVEYLRGMTNVKMTEDMVKRYFAKLYAPDSFVDPDNWQKSGYDFNRLSTNKQNVLADLVNTLEDNLGYALSSAEGTLYGALQTVTFFQDHEARTKNGLRWESATIGNGNRQKNKALELAITVLGEPANDTDLDTVTESNTVAGTVTVTKPKRTKKAA